MRRSPEQVIGQRFGRLVAVEAVREPGKKPLVRFRCDCGTEKLLPVSSVFNTTKSCGCLRREGGRRKAHSTTHGQTNTDLYRIWRLMRRRCVRPADAAYASYGGRGITVCTRWQKFENFRDDMAPRPSSRHSIDRIDNDGPYSPDNCRWATSREQNRNRRSRREVVAFGETKSVMEWSEDPRCRVRFPALYRRLDHGWKPEIAITQPPTNRWFNPMGVTL